LRAIRFGGAFHVALTYDVLSRVDLGRDAANLYRAPKPRLEALEAAIREAGPAAIQLQAVALAVRDLAELHVALRSGRWAPRSVADTLCAALDASEAAARAEFDADDAQARLTDAASLAPVLEALRRQLWSCSGAASEPPPLTVIDAPALGRHGRGWGVAHRVVAVDLSQPLEHLLWQIFHEEVHPVSDAELDAPAGRHTDAADPGFALHRRIEAHAIARGREVVVQLDPGLLAGYDRWVRAVS